MQVIKFGQQLNTPIVICLGFFGSMHAGHVALLDEAKSLAKSNSAKVALFTFDNNHLRVLGKDLGVTFTFDERLDIYADLGVDYVVSATFDKHFMSLDGDSFMQKLCQYCLKGMVCGFDYTCGRDRKGADFVQNCLADTCPVKVVNAVCVGNQKVSTTLVRSLLQDSQIEQVNTLLSQPFFVKGTVVHGRNVGNKYGFPTANLQVDDDKVLPVGVFCGKVNVDGNGYKCIVNVGDKPTFCESSISVEVHVINYDADLYGKELKVYLTKFLRGICKFATPQHLVEQLQKDKEVALDD